MKNKICIYIVSSLFLVGLATSILGSIQKTQFTLDKVILKTKFRFYSDELYTSELYKDRLGSYSPEKLKNGQIRYGPGNSLKYRIEMPYASGDLDGDNDKDYAILIFHWNGGSGQFLYLTTVLNTNKGPKQSSIVSLGDRVQVEQMEIINSVIIVDIVDLRYGDRWQEKYILVDGLLQKMNSFP